MKRNCLRSAALCAAVCALLAGCAPKAGPAPSPSASAAAPAPTPVPTLAPTPTPEDPDGDPYDEADYYFDFGQDDRIALNYDVTWPQTEMPDWEIQPNARVSALLTLQNGEDSITVLMEDAPEHPDLASFAALTRELMTYAQEGIAVAEPEKMGDRLLLRGSLPDGGAMLCCVFQVDGLFVTAELRAGAETAESASALFEETFLPGLKFTYTEIEELEP